MGLITLITGGAKSGKSAFAEQLAQQHGKRLGYIATAMAGDAEMRERIRRHQERRDSRWHTLEESLHPSRLIATLNTSQKSQNSFDVLLLDCLTVLISNILLDQPLDWDRPAPEEISALEQRVRDEIEALAIAAQDFQGRVILVGNEVGFGIVPPSPLARFFRDCAGAASQYLAAQANAVYLVVAGLPLCLKDE